MENFRVLKKIVMYSIENEFLHIKINTKGAELKSIYDKISECELLWQADPTYWGKSSPILFPIVGALKDETYFYQDKSFRLPRHGFARDNEFTIVHKVDSQCVFELLSDEGTKSFYPFDFSLKVSYSLEGKGLAVKYDVKNTSFNEDLYFSVGGHPAFSIGDNSDEFSEYKLVFNRDEILNTTLLQDNLLQEQVDLIKLDDKTLALDYSLFERDVLVISEMNSDEITLMHNQKGNIFQFSFENFPYFGIWTMIGANFICLEPWSGVADVKSHNQQLVIKEGINRLEPLKSWCGRWNLKVF